MQNKLSRDANMLRYKLDDLPSNADDSELQAIQFGTKKVIDQFQSASALANTFVINADQAIATGAMARLKFVENSLGAVSSKNEKIVAGLKEVAGLLAEYSQVAGQADREYQEDRPAGREMTEFRGSDRQGLQRDEGGSAGGSAAARSRVGCRHRRDRAADPDARGGRHPARRRAGAACSATAFRGR